MGSIFTPMTMGESNMDRIDPSLNPYPTGKVRSVRRLEPSTITISSTQPQQRMRVRLWSPSPSSSLVTATNYTLDWANETFDTAGLHDPASNPSRITIPSTGLITGTWLFHGVITWTGAPTTGNHFVRILRNGTTEAVTVDVKGGTQLSQEITLYVNDPKAGDYFQLQIRQESGANDDIAGSEINTYFEAYHA